MFKRHSSSTEGWGTSAEVTGAQGRSAGHSSGCAVLSLEVQKGHSRGGEEGWSAAASSLEAQD